MTLEPENISSDREYQAYRTEIDRLVVGDPEQGTPDGDRLILLVKLVENYEKRCFPFRRPDEDEMLRFRKNERAVQE